MTYAGAIAPALFFEMRPPRTFGAAQRDAAPPHGTRTSPSSSAPSHTREAVGLDSAEDPRPGAEHDQTRIGDIAAQFAQHQQTRRAHAALDLAVIGDHHQIAGTDLAAKVALDSHGLLEHQAPRDIDIAGHGDPRPFLDPGRTGQRRNGGRRLGRGDSPPRRRRRECIPRVLPIRPLNGAESRALRAREKRGRRPRARRGPSRAAVRRSGRYLSHKGIADGSCSRTAD